MKQRKLLFGLLSITLLLMLMNTAVASPRDDMGRDRGQPRMGDHGMQGGSDYMEISGEIIVDDGITISLSIEPTQEMIDRMEERRPENAPSVDDMSNSLNVTLYELVEFVDVNNNGYDANDTVISTYALNDTNLGELEVSTLDNITTYTISSTDGVFSMIVEVNITDNLPHDWKWSLLIEYPFESDTSSLALLHNVESSRMDMVDPQQRYGHRQRAGMNATADNYVRYENNSMITEGQRIPIVFSWDTSVVVDNNTEDVVATSFADNFALTIPQGELIDYDPRLDMDIDAVSDVEDEIAIAFGDAIIGQIPGVLGDTVISPTVAGLLLTIGAIAIIIIITNKR